MRAFIAGPDRLRFQVLNKISGVGVARLSPNASQSCTFSSLENLASRTACERPQKSNRSAHRWMKTGLRGRFSGLACSKASRAVHGVGAFSFLFRLMVASAWEGRKPRRSRSSGWWTCGSTSDAEFRWDLGDLLSAPGIWDSCLGGFGKASPGRVGLKPSTPPGHLRRWFRIFRVVSWN